MRLIDADALLMKMNLAIAILEGTMKNLGLQDDAECQMELKAHRDIRDGIKDEPTIEPEPMWISCSKRSPDNLEEVNVTYVNHDPEPYYASTKDKPFTASAVYYKGEWYWYSSTCVDVLAEYGRNDLEKVDDAIEITAWRPLPEPYQGGDA